MGFGILPRIHAPTLTPGDVGGYASGGTKEANVTVGAYVLIQAQVGRASGVEAEVAKLEGVKSTASVTGPYDVIARVEAESVDELGGLVAGRIQLIDGITRTLTCPVINL